MLPNIACSVVRLPENQQECLGLESHLDCFFSKVYISFYPFVTKKLKNLKIRYTVSVGRHRIYRFNHSVGIGRCQDVLLDSMELGPVLASCSAIHCFT